MGLCGIVFQPSSLRIFVDANIEQRRDEATSLQMLDTMALARSKERGSNVSADGLHAFHFIHDKGNEVCFLVYCDKTVQRKFAFHFLDWVQKQFMEAELSAKLSAQELSREMEEQTFAQFAQEVEASIKRYNRGEPIRLTLNKARAVSDSVARSFEEVLQRGEHIDRLAEQAAGLRCTVAELRVEAQELKRQKNDQNRKCQAIVLILALAVIASVLYTLLGSD